MIAINEVVFIINEIYLATNESPTSIKCELFFDIQERIRKFLEAHIKGSVPLEISVASARNFLLLIFAFQFFKPDTHLLTPLGATSQT